MWKIVINAQGQPAFVLVDWTDIILDNPALDSDFELEKVKYFRGKAPVYFDRGNEENNIAFTFSTVWDDLAEAIDWTLGVRKKCPRIGDVVIQGKGYTGGNTTRVLAGAAIRVNSLPSTGVTTFTRVQIHGGLLTTTTT